ncbi:hypothetical protein [Halarcobacter ebronensis]|uniref:Uncharacterized protein n=1 Tax=Halarcobacter ebronensis TaxID=1462615 RepID=A0A4Q1AQE1_9BACT|nr:hypothetical protein [Halarcobacter ebronensis]QKF81580.1 hypothetical protein AEBR_1084 [Halarcobacter ebronensis]RXK05508.1 hypothetical protein CRV07_08330 [Halarcobacter ebronensis]
MDYKFLKNSIVFLTIGLFYVGCSVQSQSLYSHKNSTLILGEKENPVVVKVENADYKVYPSWCIDSAYTLNEKDSVYGNLFLESITLDFRCHWNGLPSGFFEYNFKLKLKLSDVKTVESIEVGRYTFRTFEVDGEYYSIISRYLGQNETFIVDYEGKLYDKLLKSLKKDYVNKYLNKKRFYGFYDESLVRKNMFNGYYSKESEKFDE